MGRPLNFPGKLFAFDFQGHVDLASAVESTQRLDITARALMFRINFVIDIGSKLRKT